jgi:hypothetical protein
MYILFYYKYYMIISLYLEIKFFNKDLEIILDYYFKENNIY